MNKKYAFSLLVICCSLLLISGCNTIEETFRSDSPYENYRHTLLNSELGDKSLVQEWIQAGDSALTQAVETNIPRKSTFTYFRDNPVAFAWEITMEEGRILNVKISQPDTSQQIFVDLFSIDDDEFSRIMSAEDSLLQYQSDDSETIILRIQPELLVSGSIVLTLTDEPTMSFPVAGSSTDDIQSFWGAPRDAGARRHEGVDIFVERGTPVVAAADGYVRRTGATNLGGNVVWLRSNGRSLYYAHLDSIIAQRGQEVQIGDTLGFVGNSGNARTTPPHLHFGIYRRGATNPLPFIAEAKTDPADIDLDITLLGKWARISGERANIRPLPSTEQPPVTTLSRNDALLVTGATDTWYQTRLPDGRTGFIFNTLLESADDPLNAVSPNSGDALFNSFSDNTPLLTAFSPEDLQFHAHFGNRRLVQYQQRFLWMGLSEQLEISR